MTNVADNINYTYFKQLFKNKINKAIYRGGFTGNDLTNKSYYNNRDCLWLNDTKRGKVVSLMLTKQYSKYINFSFFHPDFINIINNFKTTFNESKYDIELIDNIVSNVYVLDQQQMKYKFLLNIDGNGVSDRILRQSLYGSVLFMYRPGWYEYWWNDTLIPYKHYIPFYNEMDLIKKLTYYIDNIGNTHIIHNLTQIAWNLRQMALDDAMVGHHRHDCYTINLINLYKDYFFTDNDFTAHLQAYGLRFVNSINMTNMTYVHSNAIHIHNNWLLYDCSNLNGGLGNTLSVYWAANSIAYWSGYNFKLMNFIQHKCPQFTTDLFLSKLPNEILSQKSSNIAIESRRNKILILNNENNECIGNPSEVGYIHTNCLLYTFFNPYYQDIIHNQTMIAFTQYFNKTDILNSTLNEWDVVIHIRCGDILQMGKYDANKEIKHRRYGFLTLNYIKHAIVHVTKTKFRVDDWILNMQKTNSSIWIVSQLSKKSGGWRSNNDLINKCNVLVNNFVDNGLKLIFPDININICYDGDINSDYFRMMNARLLICSTSTFCLHPAIANINYVILPSFGPWTNLSIMYDKNLLPKNTAIIDNLNNNWYVSYVNDYKSQYFNDTLINTTIDINLLSKYLCEH